MPLFTMYLYLENREERTESVMWCLSLKYLESECKYEREAYEGVSVNRLICINKRF